MIGRYIERELLSKDTKALRACVGQRLEYVIERDIDKSGRGYYNTRIGVLEEVYHRHLLLNDEWHSLSSIREIAATED